MIATTRPSHRTSAQIYPVKDTLFLFRRLFFSLNRVFGVAEVFNEVLDSWYGNLKELVAGQQQVRCSAMFMVETGLLRAPSSADSCVPAAPEEEPQTPLTSVSTL